MSSKNVRDVLNLAPGLEGRYYVGSQPFIHEPNHHLHIRTLHDMRERGLDVARKHYETSGQIPTAIRVYRIGRNKFDVELN